MKTLTVFGTRPEAIKLAPVLHALGRSPAVVSRVCLTGQHREMVDQVITLFGLRVDHDLRLMQPDQTLSELTARSLEALSRVLEEERPDMVLVQGDTTTAFTASLAAYYHRCPVAHVEAGLRSGDKYRPFPEEINRRLIDVVSDLWFAPTERARTHLLQEGVLPEQVHLTGNTGIDALVWMQREQATEEAQTALTQRLQHDYHLTLDARPLLLVTGHRRESFGAGFQGICAGLKEIASRHPDVQLVYPVHLNPQVQEPVYRLLGHIANMTLLAPVDYGLFVFLLTRTYLILTDSGGIQEEATFLGIPTLVMRETTERPEALEAGTAQLVGTQPDRIASCCHQLLTDEAAYASRARAATVFGDGRAASRIVRILRGSP